MRILKSLRKKNIIPGDAKKTGLLKRAALFRSKSIKTKLVLTFALLIIIPVLLVTFVAINTYTSNLIEKAKENLTNATAQTNNYYEITLKQISQGYISQIVFDPKTTEFLKMNENDLETSSAAQKVLQNLVATYPDVINGGIILKDNNIVVGYPAYLNKEMQLAQTPWAQKISGSESGVWLDDHSEGLPSSYGDDYVLSYGKSLNGGIIVLDIKEDVFRDILSSVHVGDNARSYIITSRDRIITSRDNKTSDENLSIDSNPLLLKVKEYAQSEDRYVFTQSQWGETYIISYTKSETTGWLFITIMPESEITAVTKDIQKKVLIIGTILIVFAVLIGMQFSHNITNALKKLMDFMEKTQKGDLRNVIELKRSDEIGKLSDGLNEMISQIRELIVQSKEAVFQVDESSRALKTISNESMRSYSEVAKAIEDVAIGASHQAMEVQKMVESVALLADKINNAVNSTKQMGDISSGVLKMTSVGIESVNMLSTKAKETSEITESVVNEIRELNEYVKNIDKITGILENIADQTNLLALNAAIEAARAGDQGKGFAVVAEEVRKLAEQSNNSTKEIQGLIAKILNQTENSVNKVNQADKTIMEQNKMVEQTVRVFSEINNATTLFTENINKMLGIVADLAGVKDQVMTSINNIAHVTDHTAASAEEVSAHTQEQLGSMAVLDKTAQNLNYLANNLVSAMDKFKV